MSDYIQHTMLGLFRKETGIVITGANEIVVSQTIAARDNGTYDAEIDPRFQNYNHASDTFTRGFEFVEVTAGAHSGAFIGSFIAGVNDKTATLSAATWNGETVTVGYYARGTGVGTAAQTLAQTDEAWPHLVDGVAKAINTYGSVNPTEEGLVFDHQMAYSSLITLTAAYQTVLEYDGDSTITGTWGFSNARPWYITAIIVEFNNANLGAGEAVELEWSEDGTIISNQRAAAAFSIGTNHALSRVYCTEWDDGSGNPMAFGYLPVGMVLSTHTKIKVRHAGGVGGLCKIWLAGWYMPDDLIEWGAEELYGQPTVPAPIGLYTEDFFTASDNTLTLDPNPCVCMDMNYRTHPHYTENYRYGIEFVKNLTQNTFILTDLIKVDDDILYFDPVGLDDGDVCLVAYYTYESGGAELMVEPGSTGFRGQIDAVIDGCNRMDRVDFGNQTFPYGDDNPGKFSWGKIFSYTLVDSDDYEGLDMLTEEWRDIFVYDTTIPDGIPPDIVAFGARGGPPGMDETPFFPTAFLFEVDRIPVDPGNAGQFDGYVELLMQFNSGVPNVRKSATEYRYYPLNSPHDLDGGGGARKLGDYLGAFTMEVGNIGLNVENHVCYIPLGMMRCYSFRVQARVKSSSFFHTEALPIRGRQCWLQGWYVDDS